eukprot:TRINITY_DN47454_c0_g1_i1.p1 TRINITY_DN47454_c0_g1~~TRINITY_DN47454_c0_g1_i1.p1  ORF type:complete len:665 (-),score=163.12 TRINITY_DN47454_c0_g1_i1:231-2225(-)
MAYAAAAASNARLPTATLPVAPNPGFAAAAPGQRPGGAPQAAPVAPGAGSRPAGQPLLPGAAGGAASPAPGGSAKPADGAPGTSPGFPSPAKPGGSPTTPGGSGKTPASAGAAAADDGVPKIVLPVEHYFPDVYRALQVMHLDHICVISGRLHIAIWGCLLLSLGFSIFWLSNVFQGTCLTDMFASDHCKAPGMDGFAKFICLYRLLGSVVFLIMSFEMIAVLSNFDSDPDGELCSKKMREIGELKRQCSDVLQRAQGQASELCDALSQAMKQQLNATIGYMQNILKRCGKESKESHDAMAKVMSKHLFDLRRPALSHVDKIMELAGSAGTGSATALKRALAMETQQSTLQMLLPDVAAHALPKLDPPDEADDHDPENAGGWTAADYIPNAAVAKLLQELSPKDPADKVLLPVCLVMKWLNLLDVDDAKAGDVSPMMDHLTATFRFPKTPLAKRIYLGLFTACFFIMFYVVVITKVLRRWINGGCGSEYFQCTMQIIKHLFIGIFMVCFVYCLVILLMNLGKLDTVFQVRVELRKLEDFKRQIDGLNAHALAETNEEKEMLQQVQARLTKPCELVDTFVQKFIEGPVTPDMYRRLVTDLQTALPPPPKKPEVILGGGKKKTSASLESDDERSLVVGGLSQTMRWCQGLGYKPLSREEPRTLSRP